MRLYIEGRERSSARSSVRLAAAKAPLLVGQGSGWGWYGDVSSVAVFDHALSRGDVLVHYEAVRLG